MTRDIYVFGSIIRGEIHPSSDVDVLVIENDSDRSRYPKSWSVYSEDLIRHYHSTGRLFAWHLHLESRCIFSERDRPLLDTLGQPAPYVDARDDLESLAMALANSVQELSNGSPSCIFELGLVHTCMRDIAMSASWHLLPRPCFSRDAPYKIGVPPPIDYDIYRGLTEMRHASTRGAVPTFDARSLIDAVLEAEIERWVAVVRSAI